MLYKDIWVMFARPMYEWTVDVDEWLFLMMIRDKSKA